MALAALRATREAEAKLGPPAAALHRRRAAAGRAAGRQGVRRQGRGGGVSGRPAGGRGEPAVAPGVAARSRPTACTSCVPPAAREPRDSLGRGAGAAAHPSRPRHRVPDRGPPHMSARAPQAPRVRSRRSRHRRGAGAARGGRSRRPPPPEADDAADRAADARRPRPARPALGHDPRLGARRRRVPRAVRLVRAPGVGRAGARGLGRARHARAAAGRRASPRSMLLLRELDRLLAPEPPRPAHGATSPAPSPSATCKRERKAALRLAALYARRPEQAWSVRRFREHARDVHDAGRAAGARRPRHDGAARPRGAPSHHALGQARRHRHGAVADGADRGELRADREPAAAAQARRALRRPARLLRRAAARPAGVRPTWSPPAASP